MLENFEGKKQNETQGSLQLSQLPALLVLIAQASSRY